MFKIKSIQTSAAILTLGCSVMGGRNSNQGHAQPLVKGAIPVPIVLQRPIIYFPKNYAGRSALGIIASASPQIFNTPFSDKVAAKWNGDGTAMIISQGGPLFVQSFDSKQKTFGSPQELQSLNKEASDKKIELRLGSADQFACSPNNALLAYGDTDGLSVFNLVTGENSLIAPSHSNSEGEISSLAWSPDSKNIAFSMEGSDEIIPDSKKVINDIEELHFQDLYTIGADGKNLHKIGHGFSPTWAMDGKTIVAIIGSWKGGNRIVAYNQSSGKSRVLRSSRLANFRSVVYSPDKSKLAILGDYDSKSVKSSALFLTNPNGVFERILATREQLKLSSTAAEIAW